MNERDEVRTDFSAEEAALQAKVSVSEAELGALERNLQDVDGELAELVAQNGRFEALREVCRSLEQLDELGGTALFWAKTDGAEHIEYARKQVKDFSDKYLQVEKRRDEVLRRIGRQNHALDCLHYDLLDAMEREEKRRGEWLVEREADELPAHDMVMPWQRGQEEDRRYRRLAGSSLAASLAVSILIGAIAIPIPDKPKELELPERMARLVREQLPPPKPAPIFEQEMPEPESEPEPEAELVEELPTELVPESVEVPKVAAVEPDIKEQVRSKGLLAFSDSFASRSSLRPTTQLGAQARTSSAGEDAVGRPTRAMVTSNAPGSSGGINLADISRNVGGGGGPGIGGVAVSRVSSTIGNGGDGFGDRPLAGGALAGRTDEEIQIVFDRYKAALYRLYNRELRKDPTLRGQIIIKLTIEPDGSVSFCALQSSDMNAPLLAEQVVGRVSTFDFGAKEDISAVTIIYPIDFLPAV